MAGKQTQLDKASLKQVLFCALLMSAVDGEIHQKELEVIKNFRSRYWRIEFGEFKPVQDEIFKKVKQSLQDRERLSQRLDTFLNQLTDKLTSRQRTILLELVANVMVADEKTAREESDLFAQLLDKLGS